MLRVFIYSALWVLGVTIYRAFIWPIRVSRQQDRPFGNFGQIGFHFAPFGAELNDGRWLVCVKKFQVESFAVQVHR